MDAASVTSRGNEFQRWAAAAPNASSPYEWSRDFGTQRTMRDDERKVLGFDLGITRSDRYPGASPFSARITLDLSPDVVQYLLSDGIIMPKGCEEQLNYDGLDGYSDDEVTWDEETDSCTLQAPDLSSFTDELKQAIADLDGEVFPKLNWSSPKDAVWISLNNSLKCTCPRDVYLLLKSSDFISHDLTQPFKYCDDETQNNAAVKYQLTLRRWQNIDPAGEFRCFVVDNKLKGISQRHHTSYFAYIEHNKDTINEQINMFFHDHILEKFPDSSYIFDVYWRENKVILVDFNPFGRVTDTLLFSWNELNLEDNASQHQEPIFRFVDKADAKEMMPNQYSCYTVPQDFVHLAAGEDPSKLIDLLNLKCQSQAENESSDEDNMT